MDDAAIAMAREQFTNLKRQLLITALIAQFASTVDSAKHAVDLASYSSRKQLGHTPVLS